jgi:hypothetical protein
MGSCLQEVNVRHHVGKLGAILCRLKVSFYFSISYCKDNFKCDSASNAPKCQLNNGVSIIQKLVVKLSNTSTTFSQQVEITLSKCLCLCTTLIYLITIPLVYRRAL